MSSRLNRRFALALLLLMLIVASATAATPEGPAGPNIVLISLDTVRADHLPIYGYARDTTPGG